MTPTTFRALREHLGLTAGYTADSLGVNRRTLTRWEACDTQLPTTAIEWLQTWVDRTEAHLEWATMVAQLDGRLCLHSTEAQYRAAHRSGFLDHKWWNRCAARVAATTGAGLAYEACQSKDRPRALAPACDADVE